MNFLKKSFVRTIAIIVLSVASTVIVGILISTPVYADVATDCTTFETDPKTNTWTTKTDPKNITNITLGINGLASGAKFYAYLRTAEDPNNPVFLNPGGTTESGGTISFNPIDSSKLVSAGDNLITLNSESDSNTNKSFCSRKYTVRAFDSLQCSLISSRNTGSSYGPGENVWIEGTFWFLDINGNERREKMKIDLRLWDKDNALRKNQANGDHKDFETDDMGDFKGNLLTIPKTIDPNEVGWWRISASKNDPRDSEKKLCEAAIYVSQESGQPPIGTPPNKTSLGSEGNPCKDSDGDGKIDCKTALGKIPTDPSAFVSRIL
ncbi:MAG: hypothetical protein WD988_01365, partial [Candidatus Curtissbacteria bacterium]